jgi:hypothetical protein
VCHVPRSLFDRIAAVLILGMGGSLAAAFSLVAGA